MDKNVAALMKEMLSTAILAHTLVNVDARRARMANKLGEVIFGMILDIFKDAHTELKRMEEENAQLKQEVANLKGHIVAMDLIRNL